MRQAHRPELGLRTAPAQILDGELAEPAGQGRILTAADAEDESVHAGGQHVVDEELDPLPHLGRRIDDRAHAEGAADLVLDGVVCAHVWAFRIGEVGIMRRGRC